MALLAFIIDASSVGETRPLAAKAAAASARLPVAGHQQLLESRLWLQGRVARSTRVARKAAECFPRLARSQQFPALCFLEACQCQLRHLASRGTRYEEGG